MSKPIHPLSFPRQTSPGEVSDFAVAGLPEFDASAQRDAHSWSSASSSLDFADVSETFESETCNRSCNPSDGLRCGLCERLLSQRSPWSSRRIVRSGDMPVTGVLSCCHVFHAECLEQTTPKMRRNDPPCPLCARLEEENCPEQRSCSRSRNSFPRLKPFNEDGPSRPWGCVQVGDCVEGALHVPPRNSMLLLNRSRIKKNLSLKGNSSKEFPGKLKKSGSYSSQQCNVRSMDQGAIGCSKSKSITGPIMKGWRKYVDKFGIWTFALSEPFSSHSFCLLACKSQFKRVDSLTMWLDNLVMLYRFHCVNYGLESKQLHLQIFVFVRGMLMEITILRYYSLLDYFHKLPRSLYPISNCVLIF